MRAPSTRLYSSKAGESFYTALGAVVASSFILALGIGAASAANCTNVAVRPGLKLFYSQAWGIDEHNTRYQPSQRTTISAANVGNLRLKWVYGFSNSAPRSYPLVSEDTIFIGDAGKGVVALDRKTGCMRWSFDHPGSVSSAILYETRNGRTNLFFNDRTKGVFALNAVDGTLIWTRPPPGDNPVALLSGTPLVHDGAMFVPLSSIEVGLALNPFYGCCTTSGGMAALDTSTGKTRWYRRTIPTLPIFTGRHYLFVHNYAPSGAPAWGAPTFDESRGWLFFGTGQNYSRPTTNTSDAIFALNAADGSIRWVHQFTRNDAYNTACDLSEAHPNCPKPMGPDLDFGAPPILTHTIGGRELLIAGEKSGQVYALNPADGSIVWTQRVGRGGALGGVHWGMAVNEALDLLYVPVSDIDAGHLSGKGAARPGMVALDLATGALRWTHLRTARCAERVCSPGISAAIVAGPELVFAGGLDGKLEALDAHDGKLLWTFDAWRDFPDTVNGIKAKGGAFDAHGPMLAGNQLIVSSGYGDFYQRPGNALLVFELPENLKP